MVMVEKVVVMNCHVQQKVKVEKTVCDEASVVPWEVHESHLQVAKTMIETVNMLLITHWTKTLKP